MNVPDLYGNWLAAPAHVGYACVDYQERRAHCGTSEDTKGELPCPSTRLVPMASAVCPLDRYAGVSAEKMVVEPFSKVF